MIQLALSGVLPKPDGESFSHLCNSLKYKSEKIDRVSGESLMHCDQESVVAAVYFRMGHYNADDDQPELIGYQCPFDDSDLIWACSPGHMTKLIRYIQSTNDFGDISGSLPDVVFYRDGRLERNVMSEIGKGDYTSLIYSGGRETVRDFWDREMWRFLGF